MCSSWMVYGRDAWAATDLPPDLHPLVGREIELLPRLDVERRVPGVDVAHGNCAELIRRVRVGQHLLAERFGARLGGPALRESKEEALVAGQAPDHRRGLAAERVPVRLISGAETRDIGDILVDCQLAIHVQARQ